MTGSIHVWISDLGDKFDDFGVEIWDLKGAGIFSISLLGEEIRLNVLDDTCDVTACRGRRLDDGVNVDRLGSPWSANVFGILSGVRASKLLDAERY
ncbi:hypothetical protein AVEN_6763-1 [Araneus ventricosus]|uniref:Uncharacterized protein n=1 Tax=Araneus ventricosus TaxID=182803 RepID=A0A4Y2GR91_ARAVE|nr:hypothetical protein AVEN_6763-1 [Araneus ventricosus]